MAADYDRLFGPADGVETPDDVTAETDYDLNAPAPTATAATSLPTPNGRAHPPMPVDWAGQSPPARPEPPPPPMPVEPTPQAGPVRPETHSAPTAPRPQGATHQARHARQDRRPAANAQPEHRADIQHGRKAAANGPAMPPRPHRNPTAMPPDPALLDPRAHGGPNLVPPTGQAAAAPPAAADRNGRPRTDHPAGSPNGDQRQRLAVSDLAVKSAPKKSAAKAVSRRGWRRWVHTLTRINFGLSRDEKYELDLHTRIRRTIRGSYQIGVLGLKGGAGKTAVTAALGSVFAQVRGDRILAVDADPIAGNLADRVGRQSAATIADLVADQALSHYNDIRVHTSMNAVNLEVLSAAEYSAPRRVLSEEDWRAVTVVPRYYNLVLADCGADLFGPATRSMIAAASGLVLVSSASIDGARKAAVAVDWLRHNGYEALLDRTCVVINHVVPGESGIAVDDLVRRFEQDVRPGRVIVLPWDKHIAAGTEIQIALLGEIYKRRISELAAALSDDFDRSERR